MIERNGYAIAAAELMVSAAVCFWGSIICGAEEDTSRLIFI